MIEYDQPLFRPPSEGYSLIFQITYGCSHNQCLFCNMYKTKQFCIKPLSKILQEIEYAKSRYPDAKRIFLADGDSFAVPTRDLIAILKKIKDSFPKLSRVSAYATALNILEKAKEELNEIRQLGLNLVYLGLESGDDEVLLKMKKGSSAKQNIDAVLKAKVADIKSSVMIILGLGGKQRWKEHAINSAKAVSLMEPRYLSALTLFISQDAPLYKQIKDGKFKILNPEEVLLELALFIKNITGHNMIFRSNHASNYLALKGVLSRDKDELLNIIHKALGEKGIKPEYLRGL